MKSICATVGLLACLSLGATPSTKPNQVDPDAYRAAMERLKEKSSVTSESRVERLERENLELKKMIASLQAQIKELQALVPSVGGGTKGLAKGMTYEQVAYLMTVQPTKVLRENGAIRSALWTFPDDITMTRFGRINKEDNKSFVFRFDDNGKLASWEEFGVDAGK